MTGCRTTRGGGWIISAKGEGKATFGFQLVCEGEEPFGAEVSGQLQYTDKPAGVELHGTAEHVPLETCADTSPDGTPLSGEFSGPYTPQPKKRGPGGRFQVIVTDAGEPGFSAGDELCIRLFDGVYDGYANCRPLGGGNIQTFD